MNSSTQMNYDYEIGSEMETIELTFDANHSDCETAFMLYLEDQNGSWSPYNGSILSVGTTTGSGIAKYTHVSLATDDFELDSDGAN